MKLYLVEMKRANVSARRSIRTLTLGSLDEQESAQAFRREALHSRLASRLKNNLGLATFMNQFDTKFDNIVSCRSSCCSTAVVARLITERSWVEIPPVATLSSLFSLLSVVRFQFIQVHCGGPKLPIFQCLSQSKLNMHGLSKENKRDHFWLLKIGLATPQPKTNERNFRRKRIDFEPQAIWSRPNWVN